MKPPCCYESELAGTLADREHNLWEVIKRVHGDLATPVRLTNFSQALRKDDSRPRAQPVCMKTHAAEHRQLLKVVAQLQDHPRDVYRLRAALCLCHIDEMFASIGYFSDAAAWRTAPPHWWHFCDSLVRLTGNARARESKRWHVVKRHHFGCPLVLHAAHLSPESVWTYLYEDLMGRMKSVAMASKNSMRRCDGAQVSKGEEPERLAPDARASSTGRKMTSLHFLTQASQAGSQPANPPAQKQSRTDTHAPTLDAPGSTRTSADTDAHTSHTTEHDDGQDRLHTS